MSNKYINFITVLTEFHPFHIISSSPWPLLTSSSLMSTALGFIMYLNYFSEGNMHLYTAVSIIVGCLVGWFYDVIREATYLGYHTLKVQQNVILGMLLFLVSEAMFFFSFF
jgi:cytochrome c oxidase subunit 3